MINIQLKIKLLNYHIQVTNWRIKTSRSKHKSG